MTKHSKVIVILVAFFLSYSTVNAQVAEVPRPFMPGYARATTVQGQPVIYYNPRAIRRVGPQVSQFIRAHEYAHLQLRHQFRPISQRQAEYEADILAARLVPRSTVQATQRWFARGNGGGFHHGSGIQRARRIGYGFATRYR